MEESINMEIRKMNKSKERHGGRAGECLICCDPPSNFSLQPKSSVDQLVRIFKIVQRKGNLRLDARRGQ